MFRATLVYVEIILKIPQSRDQAEPALVAQWRMSLSAVRLAYVAPGSGGLGSTPGSGGLSVHV